MNKRLAEDVQYACTQDSLKRCVASKCEEDAFIIMNSHEIILYSTYMLSRVDYELPFEYKCIRGGQQVW